MNAEVIAEIQQQIKSLSERLDGLEAKLACEKKEEFKLWEPSPCNIFYVINAQNDVIEKTRSLGDYQLLATYNYYETEKLAEQEAKWLTAARKLRALARELNPGGWTAGWDCQNYFIELNAQGDWAIFSSSTYRRSQISYFHSEEAAQTALNQLTEDEREVLFGN